MALIHRCGRVMVTPPHKHTWRQRAPLLGALDSCNMNIYLEEDKNIDLEEDYKCRITYDWDCVCVPL